MLKVKLYMLCMHWAKLFTMHNDWRLHNSPCRDVDSFRFLTNISRIFDLMKLSFCGRSSKSAVFHYIAVSCFSAFLFASRPREWNWLSRKTRRSEKYCNFIKTSKRLGERVHAGCCELHACEWERGEICRWQRAREKFENNLIRSTCGAHFRD